MQFLEENNYAGHTLLRIVSRANAIIAELLRLSAHIPPVFHLKDKSLRQKYGDILFDFSYLDKPDFYEQRIENTPELFELDQDFKDNYIDILKRFYLLYESIYKYISDFYHYLEEVERGTYVQYTIESILIDETGKQLMVEALYLYGVMLLLLDMRIDGSARERMIVSYLRCMGQSELTSISNVCHICRRTGLEKGGRKPENYPQEYFARFTIPERVISMIIGRLRSDDIYSQIAAYPFPEHRSTALSTQAAQIYVVLFFDTSVLHGEHSIMREIVDKHFPDNWVVPWFIGYTVDLSVVWQGYKAAINALSDTVEPNAVRNRKNAYLAKVPSLMKALNQFLLEGVLTEEFILEKKSKLMTCLRECNVTLRWLVLHTNGTYGKKIKDIMTEGVNQQAILDLLLNIAQFEFILKSMFQNLIDTKEAKWNESKSTASQRMRELGEYFSGEKALVKVLKIEKLEKWFSEEIAVTIDSLDFKDITASTRKIQQLLKALVEVEQYHQLETNLQVTQFLNESRAIIQKMLRIANLGEDVMISFSIITDCSYMFEIMDKYRNLIQQSIKKDPGSILKLRSTFVKLSTVLQLTLIRINQAKSRDIISVSQYYSGELVAFVRRVVEVIPKSMFVALKEVIDIQTNHIKEIPSKLETEHLKDYAQMQQRFRLSELTYKVSVFTKGILAMKTTFVGLVAIDPKQLLEDGIRKELVEQISISLHNILNFESHKMVEFEKTLLTLASTLDGFKRSFQYLQDYINIDGLKIWQEEFSRIIGFNVEQECNQFLKRKIHDWDSIYQSIAIPIPKFKPVDTQSANFIGRLGREIILQTMYNRTIFVDHTSAWYDYSGREIVSLRTFNLLANSVEVFGIKGIDRLFSFMVVSQIKSTHLKLSLCIQQTNTKTLLTQVMEGLGNGDIVSDQTGRSYQHAFNGFQKLFDSLLDLLATIGHLQLLRRQIASILKISSKLESNMLFEALKVFNDALIKEIRVHERNKETNPFPDNEHNDIIAELTPYLENVGLHDPLSQIYIITASLKGVELLLFFATVLVIQRCRKDERLGILVSRKSKGIDPAPFTAGLWTFLKQQHSGITYKYLAHIGQWIKYQFLATEEKSNVTIDVYHMCLFLEYFCKISGIPRDTIHEYVPSSIFDSKK